MILVGRALLTTLMDREDRQAANRARALRRQIASWVREVEAAKWRHAMDVKALYGSADPVGGNRMVFDVCGNRYRIVAEINYAAGVVRVRFAGTHAEYDRIDARTV